MKRQICSRDPASTTRDWEARAGATLDTEDSAEPPSHQPPVTASLRQNDGVDDVNDAVRGSHVGRGDGRVVDHDLAAHHTNRERRSAHGLGCCQLRRLRRGHCTCHDVIGQNGHQLGLVLGLQQAFDRSRRKLGKRRVGRGEDRKRSLTLECIYQSRRLQGRCEGLERACRDRRVDDVLGRRLGAEGWSKVEGDRERGMSRPLLKFGGGSVEILHDVGD